MPFKSLPPSPSLDHLKNQARDLQKALKSHELQAFQRIREFHPKFRSASDQEIRGADLTLGGIQLAIAREYCFPSWAKLRAAIQKGMTDNVNIPFCERIADPAFRNAVELLDAGDEVGLLNYLREHPIISRQRVFFNSGDYFGQPSLLEFIAENPIRNKTLPANAVAMAMIVLEAGARDDRSAIDRTLELVASGRVARECGVQVGLIDLLCDYGGDPESAMAAALGHGEFDAVEALIRRGAEVDLPVATATGRTETALGQIGAASPDERHRSMAYASQFGRIEILRALLESGEDPSRFNPIGCHSHSTPLHQAALAGHLEAVRLLVEFGADAAIKDIMFGGTPSGWAEHTGQKEIVEFLNNL